MLRGAILRGTMLKGTMLKGTMLKGTILRGAILTGTIVTERSPEGLGGGRRGNRGESHVQEEARET